MEVHEKFSRQGAVAASAEFDGAVIKAVQSHAPLSAQRCAGIAKLAACVNGSVLMELGHAWGDLPIASLTLTTVEQFCMLSCKLGTAAVLT